MDEAPVLAPEVERGEISWRHGMKLIGVAPHGLQRDLKIVRTRTLTGVKVESGWLSMALTPEVHRYDHARLGVVEVQTFRCHDPARGERWLMVCGTCGDMCFGQPVDVAEAAIEGCRCCGAGLAPVACITPHTFGSCLRCPEGPALFTEPLRGLTVRPEDRPTTKAGPAAPGSGFAAETRVEEVDRTTGEVYVQ